MPFRCAEQSYRGFTVIELMAALAVTFIVGAAVYSALHTYSIRSEVVAGMAVAQETQNGVAAAFRQWGEIPGSAPPLRPAASQYVEAITVVNGRVDILYGGQADRSIAGRQLSLTPYETAAGEIVWLCGNKTPGLGVLPLGFMEGGLQASHTPTTIEERYLPPSCK